MTLEQIYEAIKKNFEAKYNELLEDEGAEHTEDLEGLTDAINSATLLKGNLTCDDHDIVLEYSEMSDITIVNLEDDMYIGPVLTAHLKLDDHDGITLDMKVTTTALNMKRIINDIHDTHFHSVMNIVGGAI